MPFVGRFHLRSRLGHCHASSDEKERLKGVVGRSKSLELGDDLAGKCVLRHRLARNSTGSLIR